MEREFPQGTADFARNLEGPDREQLRTTFRALDLACTAAGIGVDALLAKPAVEVIEFALAHSIDVRDLRDICELLIRRLDALDSEFAALKKSQTN